MRIIPNFSLIPYFYHVTNAGHSISLGNNAIPVDSGFTSITGRQLRDSMNNIAIGGIGSIDTYMQLLLFAPAAPNYDATWMLAGRNEFVGTVTDATFRKVVNSYKASIVNANLAVYYSARTSIYVDRSGGTFSNYTNLGNSGRFETKTHEGISTSTIGDTLRYFSPISSTSVVVMFIGYNTGGTTQADVIVDGVLQRSVMLNLMNDGTARDIFLTAGTRCPVAAVVTGLSNTVHTVKVVNKASGTMTIDYFGHLQNPNASNLFLMIKDIDYAGTAADIITWNIKADSIRDALNNTEMPGFHIKTFNPNTSGYVNATMISIDGIHPGNLGHYTIAMTPVTGMVAYIISLMPKPDLGTFINTGNGMHGYQEPDLYHPAAVGKYVFANEVNGLVKGNFLPMVFNGVQNIITNGNNLTLIGNGPNSGIGGAGIVLSVPNITLTDSASVYIRAKPNGVTQPAGFRFRDGGSNTIRADFAVNSTNLSGVESTHAGADLFLDATGTGSLTNSWIFYTKAAGTTTAAIAGRIWNTPTSFQWQIGDSANASAVTLLQVGTTGARFGGGNTATRVTSPGGTFRSFNPDSLHRPETFVNATWRSLAFLQDLWGMFVATDANFTTSNGINQYVLPAITAGRTVTLATAERPGQMVEFMVTNTTGNAWTFASTVKDLTGATITALTNGTTTRIFWDGTQWNKK